MSNTGMSMLYFNIGSDWYKAIYKKCEFHLNLYLKPACLNHVARKADLIDQLQTSSVASPMNLLLMLN